MIIWIWSGKQNDKLFEFAHPDRTVYVPVYHYRAKRSYMGDVDSYATECYTKAIEARNHHWFSPRLPVEPPDWAEVQEMTFYEFMKGSFEQGGGMNPFWDIGRLAFFNKWLDFHGDKVKDRGKMNVR